MKYDVIIVGAGVGGLYCAMNLPKTLKVLVVCKGEPWECNTFYAQGGISISTDKEDVQSHIEDTLGAGSFTNNPSSVEYLCKSSLGVIEDLEKIGLRVDRDEAGRVLYAKEGGHQKARIVHFDGDGSGRYLHTHLITHLHHLLWKQSSVVDLLIDNGRCYGVSLESRGEIHRIYAKYVVLASGGVGGLYRYHTNASTISGEIHGMILEHHGRLQDMEMMQFHPTAFIQASSARKPLISEAVRGEGGKIVDSKGRRFLFDYDARGELAPRDIVTRAIYSEMKKEHSYNVFLNASMIDSIKLLKRFPTISKRCDEKGIDISKKPIPVAPAAHYSMGGIKAAVEGRTSIRGLYAIGEVASTGLHGANRLASNSLLECVVCAYELADYLSFANLETPKRIDDSIRNIIDLYSKPLDDEDYNISSLKSELKNLMWNNAGIIRSEESLVKAEAEIKRMKSEFKRERKCLNKKEYEYRNMLTTAELIVKGALARKESRGAHCRSDYRETMSDAMHSDMIKQEERELVYVK